MIHLVFESESHFPANKNKQIAQKNLLFSPCFWQFFTAFPHFMPKSESLPLLFSPLLFFKELWEQFAHDSLSEKSESLFRSFPHIKQAIRSKNQREKS